MEQSNNRPLLGILGNSPNSLRIVFTDPDSGKQLRIYMTNPIVVSEHIDYNNLSKRLDDVSAEFFCRDLQYSDKLP